MIRYLCICVCVGVVSACFGEIDPKENHYNLSHLLFNELLPTELKSFEI